MVKFLTIAIITWSVATGCTSTPSSGEPATVRRPALISGTATDAERSGIVRIVGDVECSGFLITNQWAITARHCISSTLANQPQQITVAFGGTRSAPNQTTTVAEVQRSPPGPDLAVLRLATPFAVQGTTHGYQQRADPLNAGNSTGSTLYCAGWGSTGATDPPSAVPTGALLYLDSVARAPLLAMGPSASGQQFGPGDAGGYCLALREDGLQLPAGLIAGLYTDGEGVAIDLTQLAVRSWVESTLVAHDENIQAGAASVPVAATPDGQQIDLVWIDGSGQMNGTHLSGFPPSPDQSPIVVGASSDDLFATARPAAAYSSDGLHLLGKTVTGHVLEGVVSTIGPLTSGWTPVSVLPPINGGLGIASQDNVSLDLFARSSTGAAVHAWSSGGAWVSSELLGGSFDEDVLAVWDNGAFHVFGVGLSDVFHKYGLEGTWVPGLDQWFFQEVTGNVASACAVVTLPDHSMDLLVRLPNGHLGHKTYIDGWSDEFSDLGLPVPDEPSAIIAAGAIHVFARNPDGTIWHAHFPR